MKASIVIPARYHSTRFPGKPLSKILGVPMINHVWEKCIEVLDRSNVYVATDSDQIIEHCNNYGINSIRTSSNCLTGTDRVYEASKEIDAQILINVQGDEPLISPSDIQLVLDAAKNNPNLIYNAMCQIDLEEEFRSLSIPKVTFTIDKKLMYISRAPIPQSKHNDFNGAWKQVCIYAFPKDALSQFANQKKTFNESIEDIEILRFLELGYQVNMVEVSKSSIAVDYEDDIIKVENAILKKKNT